MCHFYPCSPTHLGLIPSRRLHGRQLESQLCMRELIPSFYQRTSVYGNRWINRAWSVSERCPKTVPPTRVQLSQVKRPRLCVPPCITCFAGTILTCSCHCSESCCLSAAQNCGGNTVGASLPDVASRSHLSRCGGLSSCRRREASLRTCIVFLLDLACLQCILQRCGRIGSAGVQPRDG